MPGLLFHITRPPPIYLAGVLFFGLIV
jgi:hypothetical protein